MMPHREYKRLISKKRKLIRRIERIDRRLAAILISNLSGVQRVGISFDDATMTVRWTGGEITFPPRGVARYRVVKLLYRSFKHRMTELTLVERCMNGGSLTSSSAVRSLVYRINKTLTENNFPYLLRRNARGVWLVKRK